MRGSVFLSLMVGGMSAIPAIGWAFEQQWVKSVGFGAMALAMFVVAGRERKRPHA